MNLKTILATTLLVASTNATAYNFTTNTPENSSSTEMFIHQMNQYDQMNEDRSERNRQQFEDSQYYPTHEPLDVQREGGSNFRTFADEYYR